MLNNKTFEIWFYNYNEIELCVNDERGGKTIERYGGRGGDGSSSPTEIQAIKNLTEIKYVDIDDWRTMMAVRVYKPERVLDIVDVVRANLNEEKTKIFAMKFDKHKTRREICEQLDMSPKKYTYLLNEIYEFTRGVAIVLLK